VNNLTDSKELKIAILIPAYNEGKYIHDVIRNCFHYKLDIIIVNDGSTDNTGKVAGSISQPEDFKIILINHPQNRGKGESLKTGFNYIISNNYSGVITIDGDGQHNTDEIADFIDTIKSDNPDIIVGSRLQNTKGMPFIRLATNFFTSWIISLIAGRKISDVQSGFRYISSKTLKNVSLETKNFDTEPEILLKASWLKLKIENIPISTIYHKEFVSHVNPIKDTIKFFRLVFKSIIWKRKFNLDRTRI
jgi:glycosyltransferase involved in cell wall biosynthesis